jgi:hypothetical protein
MISSLKHRTRSSVKVKQTPQPEPKTVAAPVVEMAAPVAEQNDTAPVAQCVTEVQPVQPFAAAVHARPLLSQLKGAYGMAMGMAGVVVIVCAFAVGRMYGPKTTQAAPAEPVAAATTPSAPAAISTSVSAPRPRPQAAAPAQIKTRTKSAAKDPWAKLLGEKSNAAQE